MALPLKTTAEDVRKIVSYFKTKPTGATVEEARAALGTQLLDGRKLAAYRAWSVLEKEGERYKLTARSRDYSRRPEETEQAYFQAIIDGNTAYRSVIEWMHHQGLETVTTNDVVAHWHEHHRAAVGADTKDTTLRENAITFFHLCQAAGVGKLTIGRSGHPTRLDIDRPVLGGIIDAGPSAVPSPPPPEDEEGEVAGDENHAASAPEAPAELAALEEPGQEPDVTAPPPAAAPKVHAFISHGKNMDIVDQVQTMLGVVDIESEVAEEEETAAIPVPEKVFNAMKRCNAGIICVSVDEGHKTPDGEYAINENVLIEIGAAFVLYDRRVVLVWDKRLHVPSNLQGLYRCEYEGDELSLPAALKLMKAIQEFKKPNPPQPPAE